jgi:hypothetical protein
VPPTGENVTLRRATRSAFLDAARRLRSCRISSSATHLHLGEGGADAAAHAAAERHPGVRRRAAVEEALGTERERLGTYIHLRARHGWGADRARAAALDIALRGLIARQEPDEDGGAPAR